MSERIDKPSYKDSKDLLGVVGEPDWDAIKKSEVEREAISEGLNRILGSQRIEIQNLKQQLAQAQASLAAAQAQALEEAAEIGEQDECQSAQTERLQAYTPTMAEVYRFMQSNPISSREMLDEISAESTPKSSWDMHLQSFIKLEKQCREIAEQIYDFIGESHNDADAELRFQEVSTNLAAFICETKGLAGLMGSPVRCPAGTGRRMRR